MRVHVYLLVALFACLWPPPPSPPPPSSSPAPRDTPVFLPPPQCCVSIPPAHDSHGKTTLLKHIAERKLKFPPNIDALLCEQEVKANTDLPLLVRMDTGQLLSAEDVFPDYELGELKNHVLVTPEGKKGPLMHKQPGPVISQAQRKE